MLRFMKQFITYLVAILLFVGFLIVPAYLTGCGSGSSSGGGGATPATSSISGTITDANGTPIANARVSAAMQHKSFCDNTTQTSTNSTTATFTYTDANGWFLLTNLPPGTYLLTIEHTSYINYSMEVTTGNGSSDTITLTITLTPIQPGSTTLTGTVIDTQTGNKLQSAVISIAGLNALSGTDGTYTINGVSPGENQVLSAVLPGYHDYTTTLTIPSGTTITHIIPLAPTTGTLTGRVTDTSSGIPLTDVTIQVNGKTGSTDISGEYSIPDIRTGTNLTITATRTGYINYSSSVNITTNTTTTHDFTLTQTPPNTGSLCGIVTDAETGTPLNSAVITIEGITTASASDGTYTINGIPEGTNKIVSAVRAGYLDYTATVTITSGTTIHHNLHMVPVVGTVAGTVTDSSTGTPIAGVTIQVGGKSSLTNASGEYAIPDVRTGSGFAITAFKAGYINYISSININTGTTTHDFTLTQTPPGTGSVSGTIIDAENVANLEAVLVTIDGISTASAADGTYTINGIPEGVNKSISVVRAGYHNYTTTVSITAGATTPCNIAMEPTTGTVSGTVTNSGTGTPIQNVTVNVAGKTGSTNASGLYSIPNVRTGSGLAITAVCAGYINYTGSVNVGTGITTTHDFTLTPTPPNTGTVSGTITESGSGTPLQSAVITIDGITTASAADGTYTINGIPEGVNKPISVVRAGYQDYTGTVSITSGTTTTRNISLTLITGDIVGTVTDSSTGNPIENVTVQVDGISRPTSGPPFAGEYNITGVRIGSGLAITAVKAGYINYYGIINVTAGINNHNFTMTPVPPGTATVTGTVTDSSLPGTPVENALVLIDGKGAFTAADGTYTINGVTVGTMTVTVRRQGFADYSGTVDVFSIGATCNVSLAPNTVTGTVTCSGIPIPNTLITLAAGSKVITTTTNSSGSYSMTHVPTGTYTISAKTTGFSFTPTSLTVSAGATLRDITMTVYIAHSWTAGRSDSTSGSGLGEFNSPRGIATDTAGNVYVADFSNGRLQKCDPTGTIFTTWVSSSPHGVAVYNAEYAYVGSYSVDTIFKFSIIGTPIASWGSGILNGPRGAAVDSAGNVYVADTYNHRVRKFNSTGTLLTTLGGASRGSADGWFDEPSGVAVDAAGYIYVADTNNDRIQKFTPAGIFNSKWGTWGGGNGQFIDPFDVEVDAAGYVYVVDRGNNRIQKFTSNGTYITQWGSWGMTGDWNFNYPQGIAVDAAGNVYVSDTGNHRILKYTQTPP